MESSAIGTIQLNSAHTSVRLVTVWVVVLPVVFMIDFIDFIDSVDFVADNGAVLVRDGKIIRTTTFTKECILHLIDYLHQRYPGAVDTKLIS